MLSAKVAVGIYRNRMEVPVPNVELSDADLKTRFSCKVL
jgi:hypothetical protein